MPGILAAISVIISLYYLLKQLLNLNKQKKLPPGPIALPILGHFHLLGSNPHTDLCRLARKHGPIMYLRFGFIPTIVISSPAGAELILKTHDLNFASRPHLEASKYMGYGQRGIVFTRFGSYWRNMRKLATQDLLSQLRINQFQPIRKSQLDLMVNSVKQTARNREIVDLSAMVFALSGNTICLMVFGRKYRDMDMDDKGFRDLFIESQELGARFNLGDYFPYLGVLDLQGLTRRMKDLSKIFDVFLEKVIDDHVTKEDLDENRTKDYVDTMMALMESKEAGFEFDRRHVKAVLLEILIAGSDTSATTVEWTLSELIKHPIIMKKLQNELETIVGMDHMVEESHLENLKYLDSVVKESLRLHPPAPLLLPHESIEDLVIHNFHIPKRSRIMINVWAIGRDPDLWSEPERFLPERFSGSKIDVQGHDFQLLPFGAGRRGCPGLQLGLLMVKLMVAQLVYCFDWELPNGMLPSELDMNEHFGFVTSRAKHLMAIPTYRLNK